MTPLAADWATLISSSRTLRKRRSRVRCAAQLMMERSRFAIGSDASVERYSLSSATCG
jgi:hypothetical protein